MRRLAKGLLEMDERALLEELVAWARFQNRAAFIETVQLVMPDPKHLRAYEATDGVNLQAQVAALSGLSQPTVSSLWARWRRMGLLLDRERPRHILKPSDVGIASPVASGERAG